MLTVKEENIISSKPYFERLEQLYFMFIALPMLLFVLGLLRYTREKVYVAPFLELPLTVLVIVSVLGVVGLVMSVLKYKRSVKSLKESNNSLKSKMTDYYTISLRYYFSLELVALLWSLTYYISSGRLLAVMGFVQLALIAYERATPARLAKQLRVDKDTYTKLIKNEVL